MVLELAVVQLPGALNRILARRVSVKTGYSGSIVFYKKHRGILFNTLQSLRLFIESNIFLTQLVVKCCEI